MDKRFFSRKFWFGVAAFLAGCIAFAFDKVSSTEWINMTQVVLGMYILGNVGDSAVTKDAKS